jgi:hypothetical protein
MLPNLFKTLLYACVSRAEEMTLEKYEYSNFLRNM